MPTRTGQGDLLFLMHASQDEFPRIVIAPGGVESCYADTARAFNLAEKYQGPVLVLTEGIKRSPYAPSASKKCRLKNLKSTAAKL